MKNITEADVNARINERLRTYVHNEDLVFDHLGRFLIYDALTFVVKNRGGVWNTMLTLGLYYGTYISYYANPYVASTFYIYSTFSGIFSLFNIARYFDKHQSIARIYLMQNR